MPVLGRRSLVSRAHQDRPHQAAIGDSTINFEMWMPPAPAWNGKFQTVGDTGFLDAIEYGDMAAALTRGMPSPD